MLRVVTHRFGPPGEVLCSEPTLRPTPEKSSVVVRMLASAINPSDLITIGGAYPHRTPLPFVPGFEGVGVVDEVGAGVTNLRVGQRVLPLGSAGGWQTCKVLPAEWCVPVPDDLTDNQAATAYINPLTARLMMRSMAPAPGASVGVNAANSAIGRTLLRMLHAAGARPVAIVRSIQAKAMLDREPVSAVFIEGMSLPPLDGGFDAVGGKSGGAMAAAIRPGGLLIHYGLLSGVPLPSGSERWGAVAVRPFWLRDWVHSNSRQKLHDTMAEVFEGVRSGLVKSVVEARYPLCRFSVALEHNARRNRAGKILLAPT